MNRNQWLERVAGAAMLSAGLVFGLHAAADQVPVQSQHQMMKDCMAKQKASESGAPKEDMKKSCKDLTKTEKRNADQPAATQGGS